MIKGTFPREIPIVKMISVFFVCYFIVSCIVRLIFSDACNLRSVYFVSEQNTLELEVTLGERKKLKNLFASIVHLENSFCK